MEELLDFLTGIDPLYAALMATVFTWSVTAMGASLVFLFKTMSRKVLDAMLGFTGGRTFFQCLTLQGRCTAKTFVTAR